MRRRILAIATAVTATLTAAGALFAGPVPASAEGLSVPIGTIITADPGSVVELGRVVVDTELAGPDCTWTASAVNQESAHVGNDIVIRSGGQELVLSGVEDAAGKVTSSSGSAYLVDEIVVSLHMGPDGVFSAGIDLTISYEGCQPVPPPTTEPPPTTTEATTEVEVVQQTPTTSAPVTDAPTTAVPTTATPTSVAPADTQPVLPVTGSPWVSVFVVAGALLIATGTLITRTKGRFS